MATLRYLGAYQPTGLYTLEAFGITGDWASWRIANGWAPDTLRPDYEMRREDVGDAESSAIAHRLLREFRAAERRFDFNRPRMM